MIKLINKIKQGKVINARIKLPGSKSITHRALLMAALAGGESRINNPLISDDTLLTAGALERLGVNVVRKEESILVTPPKSRWKQPDGPILLGNSGTSMRLLPALAATGSGRFVFDGTPRLRERPVGPVVDALGKIGVEYRYLGQSGYPPMEIVSKGLSGGDVLVDARQSSQFLSALLIASPCAKDEMRVGWLEPVASFPYVALTLSMMDEAGIEYSRLSTNKISIPAPQIYKPLNYTVEGDCSSASYFWAAAAMTGGEVYTYPVSQGSFQGDAFLLEILKEMGCRVLWEEDGVRVVGVARLNPVDLDMNKIPDMVPTMGVLAAFALGRTQIRNVAHLRVKESDRLHAVAKELEKFGVPVQELPDGLVIDGGRARTPECCIEVYDDHRIAMSFALMGLCVDGVMIEGAEAVAKSFPSFWEAFEKL
ncbi:MAG: 3-phosphoshikimate 1-carboxyvinyltransferase [Syntrophobacteraceae bacterium]